MLIRCWGARGSIPVSGKEYLKYGGNTPCIELRTKANEIIIIDAGTGIRKLGNKLLKENRHKLNLIFTHAHWDHIIGFPFFAPIYDKDTVINVMGFPFTQESIKEIVSGMMMAPFFPVNLKDIKAKLIFHEPCDKSFSIESVKVTSIPISHPDKGYGYKFLEDDRCFVFLTDNELGFKHDGGLDYKDYLKFCEGVDLLMHDTEYTDEEYKTKRGWGHSRYTDALKLAMEAKVKRFGLFSHNPERTDKELDAIVDKCKSIVKDNNASLECFAVYESMEIQL